MTESTPVTTKSTPESRNGEPFASFTVAVTQPCEETGNPEADAAVGLAGEAECRISKAACEGPPHASIAQRSARQETVRQMDATFLPGPTSCRFCCFFCSVATPAPRPRLDRMARAANRLPLLQMECQPERRSSGTRRGESGQTTPAAANSLQTALNGLRFH